MNGKFTVPQLLKGFIFTCLIGLIFGAIYMAAMGNFSQKICKLSHDECLLQAAQEERDVRDAFIEKKNQELVEISSRINGEIKEQETKSNTIINGYKDQLSPPTIENEYKANRLQNVPDRLLKFMVPEAKADAPQPGDISINTEEAKVVVPNRYTAVLASYNAPYKDVNIEQYCNDAGLVQWRCDIMVGIAQRESQMGKDFHCIQQTLTHSIELGQTYYHNPMGLTDINVHYKNYAATGKKNADFQGCFLRKFDSWDAFWKFMPQSFMDKDMRYYVGNWSNVKTLSGIWVNGHASQPSQSWIDTVIGVVNKI